MTIQTTLTLFEYKNRKPDNFVNNRKLVYFWIGKKGKGTFQARKTGMPSLTILQ